MYSQNAAQFHQWKSRPQSHQNTINTLCQMGSVLSVPNPGILLLQQQVPKSKQTIFSQRLRSAPKKHNVIHHQSVPRSFKALDHCAFCPQEIISRICLHFCCLQNADFHSGAICQMNTTALWSQHLCLEPIS